VNDDVDRDSSFEEEVWVQNHSIQLEGFLILLQYEWVNDLPKRQHLAVSNLGRSLFLSICFRHNSKVFHYLFAPFQLNTTYWRNADPISWCQHGRRYHNFKSSEYWLVHPVRYLFTG
jgi:hypothetical protein